MATTATAIITFLSAPTPRQLSASQQGCNGQTLFFAKSPLIRRIPLFSSSASSSSSSSSVTVDEEQDSGSPPSPDNGFPIQSEPATTQDPDALPSTRGCKACGREELEKGCNGEGRIQGGIATVPGFGWWPIKAYRPCPGFVACGGRYKRQGQSMDEVAFGRAEKGVPMGSADEAQSRVLPRLGCFLQWRIEGRVLHPQGTLA